MRVAKELAACGIYDCETCAHLTSKDCPGCTTGNGQLQDTGSSACRVYACVYDHHLATCADCEDVTCALRRSAESLCPLRGQFEKRRWWAGRMSRALQSRGRAAAPGISQKVVSRLRWYLVALDEFAESGAASVSSWQLAEKVGVNAALIRKDLSRFGGFGTPSFGYRIDVLRQQIREILCLNETRSVVWVGACCFREHQDAVRKIVSHGCRISAVFDDDPGLAGSEIGDAKVLSTSEITEVVRSENATSAVIAISGPNVQGIAQALVDGGVRAILNLSGELLVLQDNVKVTSFDLAGELLELCFYCSNW